MQWAEAAQKKIKSYTEVDFSDSLRMKSAIILTIWMKDSSDDDDDESKPRKLNVFCLFAWPEMLIVSPLFFTSLCLAVSSSRHILTEANNFYNLYREPRRAFIFSTLELTKKKDFNELINNELHRKPSATPTGPLFAKHNTDIMLKLSPNRRSAAWNHVKTVFAVTTAAFVVQGLTHSSQES